MAIESNNELTRHLAATHQFVFTCPSKNTTYTRELQELTVVVAPDLTEYIAICGVCKCCGRTEGLVDSPLLDRYGPMMLLNCETIAIDNDNGMAHAKELISA